MFLIRDCRVVKDTASGKSKGYGFVAFLKKEVCPLPLLGSNKHVIHVQVDNIMRDVVHHGLFTTAFIILSDVSPLSNNKQTLLTLMLVDNGLCYFNSQFIGYLQSSEANVSEQQYIV